MKASTKRLKPKEAKNLLDGILDTYYKAGSVDVDILLQVIFNSGMTMNDLRTHCMESRKYETFCQDFGVWDVVFKRQFQKTFEANVAYEMERREKEIRNATAEMEDLKGDSGVASEEWDEYEYEDERRAEFQIYSPSIETFSENYFREWQKWLTQANLKNGPAAIMAYAYCWYFRTKIRGQKDDMPGPTYLTFENTAVGKQVRLVDYRIYEDQKLAKPVEPTYKVHRDSIDILISKDDVEWLRMFLDSKRGADLVLKPRFFDQFEISFRSLPGVGGEFTQGFTAKKSAASLFYVLLVNGWTLVNDEQSRFHSNKIHTCISCGIVELAQNLVACGGQCKGSLALYCSQKCANNHYGKHVKICQ